MSQSIEQLCVNAIRMLSVDAVEKAKSGHPGAPMGLAPTAYLLWTRFMKHNPRNPSWPDRDRFVLSAGHGSMLLYSMLHLTGYDLPLEEIQRFRQWESRTPGHPERGLTPGVETTTGPLGQGFGNGVGMAVAARMLAARANTEDFSPVTHRVFGIVSDGDLMEGVASEAASLAGHWGLGNLVYLYDDNHITIEGDTALAFDEDVARRFEAYGWQVDRADPYDRAALAAAIERAVAERERPSLVITRSHIAYGAPKKQDTREAHGEPLGADELAAAARGGRDARARQRRAEGGCGACAVARRRQRRPRALDAHPHRGLARDPARRVRGAQLPLRHPRARHGRHPERDGAHRGLHPLRLELPGLHRLRAPADPPLRPHAPAGDLGS